MVCGSSIDDGRLLAFGTAALGDGSVTDGLEPRRSEQVGRTVAVGGPERGDRIAGESVGQFALPVGVGNVIAVSRVVPGWPSR